eukprot:432221-Rhodomonas_salina.1
MMPVYWSSKNVFSHEVKGGKESRHWQHAVPPATTVHCDAARAAAALLAGARVGHGKADSYEPADPDRDRDSDGSPGPARGPGEVSSLARGTESRGCHSVRGETLRLSASPSHP